MDYYWQLLAWGGEGWGDDFAWGLLMTLQVSVVAYAVAVLFGFLGAAGKLSKHGLPRFLAEIYTTVVRSLPELLVILLLYFSVASGAERLLKHFGLVAETFQFSSFWAAIIALAFVSGAFMTEVLRSAFLSVPAGQIEAAVSIGMSRRKIFTRIVFPQMMRHAVPGGFLWPYLRDGLWYAIFALSLNQASYNAEVIRGAIKAIPRGQIEAAKSIGMRSSMVLRRITLPQAFRSCLPVLTGDLIILLKTTSLASTITVLEVMGTARMQQRESLLTFEPLIAAGIIYFTVVFILTRIMGVVEKRLTRYRTAKA